MAVLNQIVMNVSCIEPSAAYQIVDFTISVMRLSYAGVACCSLTAKSDVIRREKLLSLQFHLRICRHSWALAAHSCPPRPTWSTPPESPSSLPQQSSSVVFFSSLHAVVFTQYRQTQRSDSNTECCSQIPQSDTAVRYCSLILQPDADTRRSVHYRDRTETSLNC